MIKTRFTTLMQSGKFVKVHGSKIEEVKIPVLFHAGTTLHKLEKMSEIFHKGFKNILPFYHDDYVAQLKKCEFVEIEIKILNNYDPKFPDDRNTKGIDI